MHFQNPKYFTYYGFILPHCVLYLAHDVGYYIYDTIQKTDIVSFPLNLSSVKNIFLLDILVERLNEYHPTLFNYSLIGLNEWLVDRTKRLIKLEPLL